MSVIFKESSVLFNAISDELLVVLLVVLSVVYGGSVVVSVTLVSSTVFVLFSAYLTFAFAKLIRHVLL